MYYFQCEHKSKGFPFGFGGRKVPGLKMNGFSTNERHHQYGICAWIEKNKSIKYYGSINFEWTAWFFFCLYIEKNSKFGFIEMKKVKKKSNFMTLNVTLYARFYVRFIYISIIRSIVFVFVFLI